MFIFAQNGFHKLVRHLWMLLEDTRCVPIQLGSLPTTNLSSECKMEFFADNSSIRLYLNLD